MTFKFGTVALASVVVLSSTSAFCYSHKRTHHHHADAAKMINGQSIGGTDERYGGPGTGLSGTGPSTFGGGAAGGGGGGGGGPGTR